MVCIVQDAVRETAVSLILRSVPLEAVIATLILAIKPSIHQILQADVLVARLPRVTQMDFQIAARRGR